MMRAFHWSLVGACLVLGLAGCARMWFAEREPWRREAEISCLRSGAVKEGPSITIIKAIDGPGACGVDYPLRVAALGDPALVSFTDEPIRPPSGIQAAPEYARATQPPPGTATSPASGYSAGPPYAPGQSYAPPPTTATGMPLSLAPPSSNMPYA